MGKTLESYTIEEVSNWPANDKDSFDRLSRLISETNDSATKATAYSRAIEFLNRKQAFYIAALYVFRKAELIKNTNSWVLTGDNFINLFLNDTVDSNLADDIKNKIVYSYEKAVSLDSNNIEGMLKLAQSYMELKNEPMTGVQILLKIVDKNPNQIDAQILLAKYGLISGQTDKVAPRLEKILSLQPDNVQALLMKADLYEQIGDQKKSKEIIEKIIKMPNVSVELKKELKQAINKI